MEVWIVVAAVVLGLVYLALVAGALKRRLDGLQAEEAGLSAAVQRAQELAQVAQTLQVHADALQTRVELAQERLAAVKGHKRSSG